MEWVRTKSDEEAIKQGCYFDIASAERVRIFFRRFLKHSMGDKAGQPFELLPWQWDRIIAPAFGWKMPDGRRRFKEVEVWVPKKNGKSTLMSGLALYLLCADGEFGSHVFSAAGDRNQAAIVYNEVATMIRANPELYEVLQVRDSSKTVRFPDTASHYKVLAADAKLNEGLNIHGLIFDELHTQPNRALYAALRYGGIARRNPIQFVLSTAGIHDEESLWWERFHEAKKVQSGETIDIHLLPCVYAMEDDEDWHDPAVWERVNPSWGETVDPTEFERSYKGALKSGSNESEFLRYRLNRATKHESSWIKTHYWTSCIRTATQYTEIVPDGFRFGTVDLSDHLDLTAYIETSEVLVDDKPRIHLHTQFWAPSQPANIKNLDRYNKWSDMGLVKLIPGPVAKQEVIEDDIVERLLSTVDTLPECIEIGVDRFNATRFSYSMQGKLQKTTLSTKLRLIAYNAPTLNDAMKYLENLILEGVIIHDNSAVMRWMLANCMASMDSSGNRKLDKAKSNGKIDGFAALLMNVYLIINKEPLKFSKYNTQPLQTIQVR